jgi:dCTP deaminase
MSDRDIRASIEAGQIGLEPLEMGLLQPSSFDVRLDRFFRLFDNHKYPYIDPSEQQDDLTRLIEVAPDEAFILHPGEFVLGSTFEFVTLPNNIAARLEGKSSLGRLGLLTHSTAGFVDPGFKGHVTLELCFFQLTSASEFPYGSDKYSSRYQGQRGPTASRSHKNFYRTDVGNTPLEN